MAFPCLQIARQEGRVILTSGLPYQTVNTFLLYCIIFGTRIHKAEERRSQMWKQQLDELFHLFPVLKAIDMQKGLVLALNIRGSGISLFYFSCSQYWEQLLCILKGNRKQTHLWTKWLCAAYPEWLNATNFPSISPRSIRRFLFIEYIHTDNTICCLMLYGFFGGLEEIEWKCHTWSWLAVWIVVCIYKK